MRNVLLVGLAVALLAVIGMGGAGMGDSPNAGAAPSAPWLTELLKNAPVGATPIARSMTLERGEAAHLLYNLGSTSDVTATLLLTVTEGWDGVTFVTQTASGAVIGVAGPTPVAATGIITLSGFYPDIGLAVQSSAAGHVTSTVAVWQR